jgi:hypothetical protein
MAEMPARLLAPFILAVALLAPASASAGVGVGIGEQQPHMFADPRFRALGLEHVRVVTPYDVACRPGVQRRYLDAWLGAAAHSGARPLVAFTFSWRRGQRWRLPSYRTYLRCFRAFRRRYPAVRDFNPWNEANHSSQPTFRRPKQAAGFYNAMKRACRRCTVAAGDLLDWAHMVPWLKSYRPWLRGRPRLWSMHNYLDVNRPRPWRRSATRRLLRLTGGRLWITETAGVVRSPRYPDYDEWRAADATHRMFDLARRSPRITRMYAYGWQAPCNPNLWDSAWFRADGSARPAYRALIEELTRERGTDWAEAAELMPAPGAPRHHTCDVR